MQYLYTTNPDKFCHEVADGIYGRPVHTSEQSKLRAKGWKSNVHELKAEKPKEDKQEAKEEVDEDRDAAVALYEEKFGKKPHHKMKTENILKEVEDDD